MAGGKRYSAGRIFLQVVPSFKNLQDDIQRAVNKTNPALERQQEKIGEQHEEARARGAKKARAKTSDQQLRDEEAQLAARLKQFQRYTQMESNERVKEAKRRDDQDRRNGKNRLDLLLATNRQELKNAQKAEAEKRAMEARNAKYLMDLRNAVAKGEIRQREAAERERRRMEKQDLALEIRDIANANKAREREEEKSERARDKIRQRRIASRLKGMRAAAEEERRLSGGAFGDTFRRSTRGAADAIGVMKIDADSSKAERKIASLREELLTLSGKDIGVDINSRDAMVEIKLLQSELNKLARKSPDVNVQVNAVRALTQLKLVEEQIDSINHKKATTGFLGMFGGASAGADDGANSFRIFNYRVLGLLTLLPILPPLLASEIGRAHV